MICQTLAPFVDNHAKREVVPMDLPHHATFLLSNHGWCSNYCTFVEAPMSKRPKWDAGALP